MKFFIAGLLCSPIMETCIEFENKEKLYPTEMICRREATITLRKMILEFKQKEFPTKILITCKEFSKWHP